MFIQAALPAVETTHLGLKTSEWIMVAAIVVGPFAAVLTQLCVQKRREIQNQKLWVFGTLMSLRAAVLHPDFVRALNYIDVVFYKNEKIRAKWKTLLNYLASDAHKPGNVTQQVLDKTRDLLAELLAEIAKELGYAYDHTHIKENAYYPTGHGLVEEQMAQIRQKVIAVLDSKASLSFKRV